MMSMSVSRDPILVKVKPEVLQWALRNSGWKIEDLAEKLRVSETTLQSWMKGAGSPTLDQLEHASKVIRRPLAAFFLPKPPDEAPTPPDYRMLAGRVGEFKTKTLLALRKARRYQRICRELLQDTDSSTEPLVSTVTLGSDAPAVAREQRKEVQLTVDLQREWKDSYEAFRELRRRLESKNIFVFQMAMPIEDARGFVLADERPVVIVVNSSDSVEARNFTLAHEYGHVLLNQSNIDMAGVIPKGGRISNTAERWCNQFASEFLLPVEVLRTELKSCHEDPSSYACTTRISRRYKVSKMMLLYRLQDVGAIDRARCSEVIERLESSSKGSKKGGSRLPQEERCIREKGDRYVSLVSRNIELGNIGYHDAIDYLSVNLKNLDKTLAKAER